MTQSDDIRIFAGSGTRVDPSDLDRCVRCGLCLSSCPTFGLTGMEGYSPRGRIATARSGALGGAVAAEYLDTCLGCRACEAVCPAGVSYGRILDDVRAAAPVRVGFLGRLMLWAVARRWRLSLASLPVWLAQRLRVDLLIGPLRGLPRIRLSNLVTRLSTNYEPLGGERGQVVLFTGCVSDAWWRDVGFSAIAVLTRLGLRVRVPQGQVCCGALHAHAGGARRAKALAERNVVPLEQFEGAIVTTSAGCGARLKEYGEALGHHERAVAMADRVADVLEVVGPSDLRGLDPRPPAGLRRIALHHACHHVHVQGIAAQPRELLEACGYEVVELGDGARCCGAAGLYALTHRDWALPLRDAKVRAVKAARPDAVAAANPGCEQWIASSGEVPPVYHPIQLVALALQRSPEDLGQPHEV